ncbi:zinc finger, CCHC-type containing protein [Tanacetum coccineum]
MASSITRFDIEKFDGKNDFGLWQIKMRALMVQQGCDAALETLPVDMEACKKAALMKKAYSDHNSTCTIKGQGKREQIHEWISFILEESQMGRIKVIKGCQVMMIGIRKKNCVSTLEAKVMTFGVQKHGGSKQVGLKKLGSKQVGFKQLGPGVETGVHGVQVDKRVWFEVELQGAQGNRESEVFQVSNDDVAVAQRWLGDKQPEEKTNMDCLVKEQEKVHLGIKVGANITVTGVPDQEGAEGNVAEKKKVKESMEANLGKLLKYNAWSTRNIRSKFKHRKPKVKSVHNTLHHLCKSNAVMESQTALELECWSNHEIIPNEDEFYSFQHQLPPLDLSPYDLMHVQQDHYLDDHDGYNMMDSMLPNPMFSSIDVLPGLHDQKMSTMNELWCCEQKKEVEKKGDNGNGNHSGRSFNNESRMALSREVIAQYFYMPITQAAKELNVGLTLLKKRCRELGIRRWPHRKLMSIQTLINNVQEGRTSANGAEGKIQEVIGRLEEEKRKLEQIPDLQLKDNTKRLRQACFKANYKKRKTMGLAPSVTNSSTSNVTTQFSSSCSSNHAGYEVMEDGYGGDYDEQEEIKSILYTDCLPSSNNDLF